MSFVSVAVDAAADAVAALQGIGPGLEAATAAAAAPTSGIAAAAQDEVSTAIARLFGDFGRQFQAASTQAQAFQERFIGTLAGSMAQYSSAEASFVALLGVLQPVNSLLPLPAEPFTYEAINYPTPFGPLLLTLFGQQTGIPPLVSVTINAGLLNLPPPLALTYNAAGPFLGAGIALQRGAAVFTSAVQTGNALGAVQALVETPAVAVGNFFVGGEEITGSYPVEGYTGYSSIGYRIPVGGLFSPVEPVTLTMYPANPADPVTVIPLAGTRLGGPLAGLVSLFTG